jgi:hypothetical protein
MNAYLVILCACGTRIKVPPTLERDTVPCPSCGRTHDVPHAEEVDAVGNREDPAVGADATTKKKRALRYTRRGSGWQSFKCDCGRVQQLSPNFSAPSITCRACRRTIEIV